MEGGAEERKWEKSCCFSHCAARLLELSAAQRGEASYLAIFAHASPLEPVNCIGRSFTPTAQHVSRTEHVYRPTDYHQPPAWLDAPSRLPCPVRDPAAKGEPRNRKRKEGKGEKKNEKCLSKKKTIKKQKQKQKQKQEGGEKKIESGALLDDDTRRKTCSSGCSHEPAALISVRICGSTLC